jgi:DNA processing protein
MSSNLSLLPRDSFPKRLLEIPDPPERLYIQGTIPKEEARWLCVVGARKYSPYGKEVCEKLIAGLSGFPIVIVSGLALGIDGIAHKAALSAGLRTVGVPGSGLDPTVLYPAANRNLGREIVESGGCLLSEFEPNFRATTWSFPQRNRIMAGLSDAVLVIEAEQKSGTLITSRLATEYNRDVFTIPGSIFSKNSEGPHMLIRLGATPITSETELLESLGFSNNHANVAPEEKYKDCSLEEKKVIELLASPLSKEDLIGQIGLPISKTNAILSIMELKNLIKEENGELRLI